MDWGLEGVLMLLVIGRGLAAVEAGALAGGALGGMLCIWNLKPLFGKSQTRC